MLNVTDEFKTQFAIPGIHNICQFYYIKFSETQFAIPAPNICQFYHINIKHTVSYHLE